MRTVSHALVLGATMALALAGCSDDGAQSASSSSSSGSHASETGSHAGSAEATTPEGVAAQYATLEEEVAAEGGETSTGPWRIAYIVEPAEPWHEGSGKSHTFREPASGETHHLEIIPVERSTGRIVPDTPITVQVVDDQGQVVDEERLNFYYSEFFHYAANFEVPEGGSYDLRAKLGAPTFFRHGERSEAPALSEGAMVTFHDVRLERSE